MKPDIEKVHDASDKERIDKEGYSYTLPMHACTKQVASYLANT